MKTTTDKPHFSNIGRGGGFCIVLILLTLRVSGQTLDVAFTASEYKGGYNISCYGASDGRLEAIIIGGTPPYSFQWSNGAFTKTIDGLTAGTYSITVTDSLQASVTKSYTLMGPDAMTGSLSVSTYNGGYNVSAQGADDGWITTEIGGGAPPYTYQWSNGVETENNHELTSGSYSVVVRDVNQCQLQLSASLTQPTPLHIVSITSPLHNGYNVSCKGGEDGAVNLTVSGGVPPYNFQWSNGNFTEDIQNLNAGVYSVKVKDANSVTVDASITLNQPGAIEVGLTAPTYPNGHHTTCYNCSNGSVATTVTGGVMPYTYSWNTGQNTQNLSNLMAGTYSVLVTDANGCIKPDVKIDLTEPDRDDWTMTGNGGTDPSVQFIGTTDSTDFVFRTAGAERMRLKDDGGVVLPGLQGAGGGMLFIDSAGALVRRGISNYTQPCTGPIAFPWLQSPTDWANVFSCYNRFGIGTDHPRERLDLLGTLLVANWNDENNYLKFSHNSSDGIIANYGTGKLLINYADPAQTGVIASETYINTGPSSPDVKIGNANNTVQVSGNLKLASVTPGKILATDATGRIEALSGTASQVILGDGTLTNISQLTTGIPAYWSINGPGDAIFSDPVSLKVGIGSQSPFSRFQVGDGISRWNMDAVHPIAAADWTTGYLGFNIHQDGTAGYQWATSTNTYSNGAAAILVNGGGDMHFVTVPKSSDLTQGVLIPEQEIMQFSRLKVRHDGLVTIGVSNTADLTCVECQTFKLYVKGGIRTEKLKVDIADENGWADHVFTDGYELMKLGELKEYIKREGHLPQVPASCEIVANGIDVAETQKLLLTKIEELTLYILDLESRLTQLRNEK
jgi:hypothetical protein